MDAAVRWTWAQTLALPLAGCLGPVSVSLSVKWDGDTLMLSHSS